MSQSYVDQTPFSFKASYASVPSGYVPYDATKSYPVGAKVYYRSKGYTINTAITGTTGATGTVNMSNFAVENTTTVSTTIGSGYLSTIDAINNITHIIKWEKD
jgi:hypothetical protein